METIGLILTQVMMVALAAVQYFVLGGAFGAGAWVVWRGLERRRAGGVRQDGVGHDEVKIHWVGLTFAVLLAAAFAFGGPPPSSLVHSDRAFSPWMALVPFLVFAAIMAGIILVVDLTLRGTRRLTNRGPHA